MSKAPKIVLGMLAVVALLVIAGVVFMVQANSNLEALADITVEDIDLSKVRNGTYTGSYNAFPIAVTVELIVKDNRITKIDLVKHVNGQGGAAKAIPDMVVNAQSLQVDAISGATYSSRVILLAIEDSLNRAIGE